MTETMTTHGYKVRPAPTASMDALVSKSGSGAVLLQGGRFLWFQPALAPAPVTCPAASIACRMRDMGPFEELTHVTLEDVTERLKLWHDHETALNLFLVALDDKLSERVRRMALEELDTLLQRREIVERLTGVLYAQPLPRKADIAGALRMSKESSTAQLAVAILEDLEHSVSVAEKGPVIARARANDNVITDERVALRVGDRTPDGTVYAGISPDTGKPMYAALKDAPLTMGWKQAMDYASTLDEHGHQDWRLPTRDELSVLFNNRAEIGGLNESGSFPSGWYWSAIEHRDIPDCAWIERFSDGFRRWNWKDFGASVRPVRS